MLGCIQPMSSPMMNMMFGLPPADCAAAVNCANASAARLVHIHFRYLIQQLLTFGVVSACARPPGDTGSVRIVPSDAEAMNERFRGGWRHWTLDDSQRSTAGRCVCLRRPTDW